MMLYVLVILVKRRGNVFGCFVYVYVYICNFIFYVFWSLFFIDNFLRLLVIGVGVLVFMF